MKRALFIFLIAYSLQLIAANPLHADSKSQMRSRLERAFLEGRYEKAAEEANNLIDARASGRDELYYIKGASLLKMGKFKDARESFEKLLAKYERSKRAFDARIGIGDSYLLEGNSMAAESAYKDILKKYPDNTNIAIVRQKLERCGRRDGRELITVAERPRSGDSTGYYSVQVGYFKSRTNAEKLARKLIRDGYDGHVEKATDSGQVFYRVKAGRYNSKKEASILAARLRDKGYSTKISSENGER